jgi:hypothetical protein
MAQLPVLSSPSTLGLTKVERRAAKEIALTRAASSVLAAREAAKVDAIASVAETALNSGALLTDLECFLVARNPAFAGRGAYINASAVTAMGNVLTRMSRSL